MSVYGIDVGTGSLSKQGELVVGPVQITNLPLAAGATKAVGQVLVYNPTNNNWENYASGVGGHAYAICFEDSASAVAESFLCVTAGDVDKSKLDATSKADADIEAALLSSSIRARTVQR